MAKPASIPLPKRERHAEVATRLAQFGAAHLDPELTGFTLELWGRVCRLKSMDCRRGEAGIWAAAVTHVIAHINFLFDKAQPAHLNLDTIADFFTANKATIGSKASQIRKALRLSQHAEPGLTRLKFMETFTTLQFSDGMILSWAEAKRLGYLPTDARIEDL